jgi:hypothetical protein
VPSALSDHRLTGLDRGRADLDQRLARPGHRTLHLLHPQNIDPAVFVELHRFHRVITALLRLG